jgi:predicted amidohydrolase YtcJ
MSLTLVRGAIYAPAQPRPTAMIVRDDTIVWIGDREEARAHADAVDSVEELSEVFITPAFVDAHVHATSTGITLSGLRLSGCRSLREVLDRVDAHCRTRPGRVVIGHGWDETRWPEGRAPQPTELDRASGGGIVYLSRIDVHSAAISSALVAAAPQIRALEGFDDLRPVRGEAHHAARAKAYGSLTEDDRIVAQRATRARAAELGIGCLHELGGPEISSADDLRGMLELAALEPGPDVVGYWGELGGADKARELGALGAAGDLFADGSLGSHTAYLRTVYEDADHRGTAYLTAQQVRDHVLACVESGLQAGFHAIGDGAAETVVAGFEEAAARVGPARLRAGRHRLEHVELVDAPLVARIARLGVAASVQPAFDAAWGGVDGMYADRLGAARAQQMNPFADLAAAGVGLAFGSDSPVTPLDPWGTVRAAVHHHTASQRLTLTAAFDAHTRGGWWAAGVDGAGVLAPGQPATWAAWQMPDGDRGGLPDLSPGRPLPTCVRTVVRGRTIFSREEAS